MQHKYAISSEGFTITIHGLKLDVGNQFHIIDGISDYGLYTIVKVVGEEYYTSTRMPALHGVYSIGLVQYRKPDDDDFD